MTDEAQTPDAGAEPVVTTETAAPEVRDTSDLPSEVAPRSVRDILEDVMSDIPDEWDGDAPLKEAPKPKPEAKRDETGKFKGDKPKDAVKPEATEEKPDAEAIVAEPVEPPKPAVAAPERLSAEAKAEWDKIPVVVQSEVERMRRELETGLAEYRERDEPLKQYREMADSHGTKLEVALQNYVAAEEALHSSPVEALARMAQQYVPGGFEAFLKQVQGQQNATPEQNELSAIRAEISRSRQELQQMQQQLAGDREAQQTAQQQSQLHQTVEGLRADMPRFDEVRDEMRRMIETGYVTGNTPEEVYRQAYQAAERLIPAAPAPAAPPPVEPVQTRAQALSVTGAPSSGSNPQHREPASSVSEALKRAFAQAGL